MNTLRSAALLTAGLALGAGTMTLTAMCTPPVDDAPVTEEVTPSLPDIHLSPCPEEDSQNCYWDAATMGNGTGTSFVNIDGTVYYPELP